MTFEKSASGGRGEWEDKDMLSEVNKMREEEKCRGEFWNGPKYYIEKNNFYKKKIMCLFEVKFAVTLCIHGQVFEISSFPPFIPLFSISRNLNSSKKEENRRIPFQPYSFGVCFFFLSNFSVIGHKYVWMLNAKCIIY